MLSLRLNQQHVESQSRPAAVGRSTILPTAVGRSHTFIQPREGSEPVPMFFAEDEFYQETGFRVTDASILARREVWKLQQSWRERYSKRLWEATGRWILGRFDWHVFTHDYCEYSYGARAASRVAQRLPAMVSIFSDGGSPPAWGVAGMLHGVQGGVFRGDLIVAADDFSWTYVFTHSDVYGSFYAESTWIDE